MNPEESDIALVRRLAAMPDEEEWFERKSNLDDPERVGRYISGMANAATLHDRSHAYIVRGIADDGSLVGTTYTPKRSKVGNEDLDLFLARMIDPSTAFAFREVTIDGLRFVLLSIEAAKHEPVAFRGTRDIRIGSHVTELRRHRDREERLWSTFSRQPFEVGVALDRLSDVEVVSLLDIVAYFDLQGLPFPSTTSAALAALEADRMLQRRDDGTWQILNLGAITLAKDLSRFPGLGRKALRIIRYEGSHKATQAKEWASPKGYAIGFEEAVRYVLSQLPLSEVIEIRRTEVPIYPEEAIRELIPNALIHQDFSIRGAGPMVEIFDNRLEVTNPGAPRVPTDRFMDAPPTSPNEDLASFIRRANICEERGTGIDKIVAALEIHQLPAPIFTAVGANTRAVLSAPRPLGRMTQEERVRAAYWHAAFRYLNGDTLTNESLRQRLGIPSRNAARASNIIREAIEAERIRPVDPNASKKLRSYVPWWA